jgi:hypothetical protein
MSVAEIGQLHSRYVRLSDRFKAAWTYNQFASGVYKNLLHEQIPYSIDFQSIYERIKRAYDVIQSAASGNAAPMMAECDRELDATTAELVRADARITASVLRRFFEGLRRQDEKILFNIVKFYLYAGSTEDVELRDKLDFLFTRVGEDFVEERGEYSPKDTLELRKQFQGLVAVRSAPSVPQHEVIELIRSVRGIREQIQQVTTFEQLTNANLLHRAREVKQGLGEAFYHPDVLLAMVECNITAKNKFARLYQDEEQRILDDSRRLLENEEAIARGFGESNPDLLAEMERFKEVKQEFDDSRAQRNVKHVVIARLKSSMNNILAQLDRGLEPSGEVDSLSDDFLLEVQHAESVHRVFGDDPLLEPQLTRIVATLGPFDTRIPVEKIAADPAVDALRLEPWEIIAFQRLFSPETVAPENEDLLQLYLRAAALRMKIDHEAHALSGVPRNAQAPPALLGGVKASLDRAKELDLQFKESLQEGMTLSNSRSLHRLYRSRLRLLRGFSGLWLIYDLRAGGE